MTDHWWARVGVLRALVEAWLLTVVLLGVLLSLYPDLPARLIQQGMIFVGAAAALWLAMRWRLQAGRYVWRLLRLLAVAVVFGLTMAAMFYAVTDWLMRQTPVDEGGGAINDFPLFLVVLFSSGLVAFVGFRIIVLVWDAWSRLTRRHLLWSIVQDHLMVAVVIQLLVIVPITIYSSSTPAFESAVGAPLNSSASLVARLVAGILPMMTLFSILVVLVLVAVLPLSAIASYFVARRTIRRLRVLTKATAALRAGNYDARVTVVGEDEIAALLDDFNRMAADLGANIAALRSERETVAALLRARRDLVAGVSHELRTPVTVLRSYLESDLAREDAAPSRQTLTVMQAEVTRLQTLIDDLFALSRAEVQALELRLTPVDAAAVVCDVVRTAAPLAWQSHRVELVVDVPSDLPHVCADTMRLEQVLRNLINNGVRHAAPGGVVAVSARAEADGVCVAVRDTGDGIAPEHLPHIWERYYHTGDGGTGLGLALVKSLVEAMDGTVAVDSRPGDGATFSVRLKTVTSNE